MKINKKGFTLVELIVVVVILGVLMAVLVPQYIQYVERARQGIVEQEAGEFHKAALIALTEQAAMDTELAYTQFKITGKSSYAPAGTAFDKESYCGRITNWWLINGSNATGESAKNQKFADSIMTILRLDTDSKLSSVAVSDTIPQSSGNATNVPTDDGAVFQILFMADGSVATEYYRDGYFIRVESSSASSLKLTGGTIPFTKLNALK